VWDWIGSVTSLDAVDKNVSLVPVKTLTRFANLVTVPTCLPSFLVFVFEIMYVPNFTFINPVVFNYQRETES
jgi:hypothetical protein